MTELWVLVLGLTAVALLHGATAGARVAAGRDGLVHHRRTEGRGAWRGMALTAGLWVSLIVLGVVHASGGEQSLGAVTDGMQGMAVIYAPIALLTVLALGIARVGTWQVRAYVNTVVLGGLSFARPAVAWAGVALGSWWARDLLVAALMAAAVATSLLVPRLMSAVWYAQPARADSRH